MAALVIVDIKVNDRVSYEKYKIMAEQTVKAFGGRYIVRGNTVETLEGDWKPDRLVVLEFESVTQAKKWWTSEMYAEAKKLRFETAKSSMIMVESI